METLSKFNLFLVHFFLMIYKNITEFSLQIFNRYGELVFESKDKNKAWDGTYKGSRQPNGSFIWMIRYKTATDNNLQQLKGTVLLIR